MKVCDFTTGLTVDLPEEDSRRDTALQGLAQLQAAIAQRPLSDAECRLYEVLLRDLTKEGEYEMLAQRVGALEITLKAIQEKAAIKALR